MKTSANFQEENTYCTLLVLIGGGGWGGGGFPGGSDGKESSCNVGDLGSIMASINGTSMTFASIIPFL